MNYVSKTVLVNRTLKVSLKALREFNALRSFKVKTVTGKIDQAKNCIKKPHD